MSTSLCLNLTSATGTRLYVSLLPRGDCYPQANDFVIQDILVPGDTSVQVSPLASALRKGEEIKLYQTVLSASVTLIGTVTVAVDAPVGATEIQILSAKHTALPGDYGRSLSIFELKGIESAPFQSSTELNQVTLLNSRGWMSKSPSQSGWNIQLTGYIPMNTEAVAGYRTIRKAFLFKDYLYIERHLPNGDVKAGTTIVSSFSDQVQGAGYVQYQATLDGHYSPDLDLIIPRTDNVSNPPPDPDPDPNTNPTNNQLVRGGKLFADWII